MTRSTKALVLVLMVPCVGLWVPTNSWALPFRATPSGQPALVSDHALFHGRDPAGFDQAQSR
jgi:hypothetical protein